MVARKFLVHHNNSQFDVDYDTEDGLQVLKFQLFSLTSVLPDEQKLIGGENVPINEDSDLDSVSDSLRLISINGQDDQELDIQETVKESSKVGDSSSSFPMSDEELAKMLQAEEEALFYQQFQARDNGEEEFERRVRPYVTQALMYEDPVRQKAARETVPVDELEEKALVGLAKEGNFKPSKAEQDHAFLLQLLYWFKNSFRWVNSPPCDTCGSETGNCGMGNPYPSEIQFGGSRVELYRCSRCSRVTRFPRYNDPMKILETRKGRCGEWANCFTLYCRAFGYDTRLILDFTDHVWTECFSHHLGRWMHLDPCEAIYDNPLLYEKGWNKKLSYAIAFAKDGVHDVTKRYTRNWSEVLTRRNITTEPVVSSVMSNLTKERRKGLTPEEHRVLEDRERNETETLERDLHSQVDASISLPGRLSGSKEWRKARSELGISENDSYSSSSCPVRTCVDEHISGIYNAFHPLFSQLIENSLSNSDIVAILTVIKTFLVDLSKKSFKERRIIIDSDSVAAKLSVQELIPSLGELLTALSLKTEVGSGGKMSVCLASDFIRTSIALPVTLDVLDNIIGELKNCGTITKNSLSLPVLKINRISCGSVLASGEELPLGIATAAFDGTNSSKWEEPNGSKGSWLVYKVRGGKMYNLEAYEFMSANDAPERDPMNWVIEGSDNGGASWHILDKQTSQIFEKRFQRKTYKIRSSGQPSNIFRLSFLSVRDVNATSRLQIGSIDLFGQPI
ncbi:peptide-N(4)-(N-acetyl-beta-glucosaminyl)asparagine amidase [Ranunculus cassubicifolius]